MRRKLKVVAACGNGTAGAFAPRLLSALGCEVVPLDCELDFTFPRYNPNPEDLHMLHAMAAAVKESGADVALGFDGDGDRCGVVDNEGNEIFADKIGVMLARDLSKLHPNATFVVDVKSTGLFASDPELIGRGVKVDYWKTGHSHIKRRVRDLDALGRLREVRPLLLQRAGRARLRRRLRHRDRRARHARPQPRQVDGRSLSRSAARPGARRPCRRIAPTR